MGIFDRARRHYNKRTSFSALRAVKMYQKIQIFIISTFVFVLISLGFLSTSDSSLCRDIDASVSQSDI